jgi:YidC/Oxa1 family membrane protein insertase
MFDNLVVQPIFNLLVFITALIPGHNFGITIILFTILVRFAMWPLVKKQLHHASAMRKMQPQIKRIKKEAAGDRQKESQMLMELYKERGISPFGSLGTIIIQFIVLLGLYFALRKMVHDPAALVNFAYDPIRDLPWVQDLAAKVTTFDETFIGLMDLTRAAVSSQGFYWPAFLLVIGSAVVQYKQSVQLMPKPKDGRNLKQILKDAAEGKQADQSEVSAAVMRGTRFLIPAMILFFTIGLASALSLYWFVSGLVAIIQQSRVLKQDEEEMEAIADEPDKKDVIEGEVVTRATGSKNKKSKSSKAKVNKRRK